MGPIHEDLEVSKFEQPEGMIEETICIKSGLLPGNNCPTQHQRRELFTQDTVPNERCDIHVTREICSEHPDKLWAPRCPDGGEPVEKVFLDRPVVEPVEYAGEELPLPWDMSDIPPEEYCPEGEEDDDDDPIDTPDNIVEVTISEDGITPVIIRAGQGEPITLRITSEDEEHEMVIQGKGVEVTVEADETVDFTFTPEQTGVYRMYCGKHYPQRSAEQGRFIVERR